MLRFLILLVLLNLVYGQSAQLTNLTVTCDENGMQVSVEFDSPFNGIIYSKNYFKDENCRFVKSNSGNSTIDFQIKKDTCGLIENMIEPIHEGKHEYRTTVIIQKHSDYQNRFDSAKSIICTWFNLYRTSITQKPIIVGSLNEEEHIQIDNSVEVFIDVRKGEEDNPFKRTVNGIMHIGERLTVSVFLVDQKRLFDVKATNCHLYDRKDFDNSRKINLTNEEGCSVDTQLFDGFKKIDNVQKDKSILNMMRKSEENDKILQSTVILTGNLNVVKFPEVTDIYVICNIEICKSNCHSKCHPPFKIDSTTTAYPTDQTSELKLTTTIWPTSPTLIEKETTTTLQSITTERGEPERDTSPEMTTIEENIPDTTTTGAQSDSTMIETTDYPYTEIATTLVPFKPFENKFVKRRLNMNIKSLEELKKLLNKSKLNYNHNGLIMSDVDNSTIILLAKVQAKEQKRSLARKEFVLNKNKSTRSVIDSYFKNRLINRMLRQNRNSRTIIIDQPNQSSARVTFNYDENLSKTGDPTYSNRQGRLLKDSVFVDHLVLVKSFQIRKA